MKNLKTLLAGLFCLAIFSGASAQKGLMIGPALGVGVNYSKNFFGEKESPFYIQNKMGLFGSGGLDVQYGINEQTSIHVGIQYGYKQYNLTPMVTAEGPSFESLQTNSGTISIPLVLHQRIPTSESRKTWVNLMFGLSIDMLQGDSSVVMSPTAFADSGSFVSRQFIHHLDKTVTTPILGVGLDFPMGKGTLNITALWNPGTAVVVEGDVREWNSIVRPFDPFQTDVPQEFPDHYFDFKMRGSTVGFRLAYWFNLGDPFSKKTEE
jgi:hypothetical protein